MFASAVHSIKAVLDVDVPGQYLDPPLLQFISYHLYETCFETCFAGLGFPFKVVRRTVPYPKRPLETLA